MAGLHRLLVHKERLFNAWVIIIAAGIDGRLPNVVGGLMECPVIAVPSNRGYGASFGGLAALLTRLSSCAAGVGVMNIDHGFGAGGLTHRINRFVTKGEAYGITTRHCTSNVPRFGHATIIVRRPLSPSFSSFVRTSYE